MTDLLPRSLHVLPTILVPKPSLDEVLPMLDEQVPDSLLSHRGNLDELGETVAYLQKGGLSTSLRSGKRVMLPRQKDSPDQRAGS